jgi:hypothetical protein
MPFPVSQIAKLLGQLAMLATGATDGVDKINRLIEAIRRANGGAAKQLDDLKQAVILQSAVNDKMENQLRIIESVLDRVQKSLKLLAFVIAAIGVLAAIALFLALRK